MFLRTITIKSAVVNRHRREYASEHGERQAEAIVRACCARSDRADRHGLAGFERAECHQGDMINRRSRCAPNQAGDR